MKKFLAVMLSAAMLLCMMPGLAFADGAQHTFEVSLKTAPADGYFVWDGSAKSPEVVVKAGETVLRKGRHLPGLYRNPDFQDKKEFKRSFPADACHRNSRYNNYC